MLVKVLSFSPQYLKFELKKCKKSATHKTLPWRSWNSNWYRNRRSTYIIRIYEGKSSTLWKALIMIVFFRFRSTRIGSYVENYALWMDGWIEYALGIAPRNGTGSLIQRQFAVRPVWTSFTFGVTSIFVYL